MKFIGSTTTTNRVGPAPLDNLPREQPQRVTMTIKVDPAVVAVARAMLAPGDEVRFALDSPNVDTEGRTWAPYRKP